MGKTTKSENLTTIFFKCGHILRIEIESIEINFSYWTTSPKYITITDKYASHLVFQVEDILYVENSEGSKITL